MTKLSTRRRPAITDSTNRPSLALRLLILHLAISPLLFWRGCADPFELVKVTWLILIAVLLSTIAVLRGFAWRTIRWRLTDVGLVLFIASASVSAVSSLSWRISLWGAPENRFGLIAMIALAILFFATRSACRAEIDRRRLLAAGRRQQQQREGDRAPGAVTAACSSHPRPRPGDRPAAVPRSPARTRTWGWGRG